MGNWYTSRKEHNAIVDKFITEITGLEDPEAGLRWIKSKFDLDYMTDNRLKEYGTEKKCFNEFVATMAINIPLSYGDDGMNELIKIYSNYPMDCVVEDSIKFSSTTVWRKIKENL